MNKSRSLKLLAVLATSYLMLTTTPVKADEYSNVKLVNYHYGMKIDNKQTLDISKLNDPCTCSVVDARMIYKDSSGEIKGISFKELGDGCTNG